MLEHKWGAERDEVAAKAAILDKTAYCRQLRSVLVKFVKEVSVVSRSHHCATCSLPLLTLRLLWPNRK
jgi:hypothetical protein